MKTFKVHMVVEIELPAKAELIQFAGEIGGAPTDHIKFGGRLLRPGLLWMEYVPSRREMNEKKLHHEMFAGWDGGTDFTHDADQRTGPASWFIEEVASK